MNPWQLAKSGTEHGEQVALFCFAAKAHLVGFKVAMHEDAYKMPIGILDDPAIPELKWFHAIPNGGNRGDTERSRAIEGGRMKAEGVKPGVLDCFWPLKRGAYSGLYIEMKRRILRNEKNALAGCSKEQIEFGQFVSDNGFKAIVCYDWEEAARALCAYYERRFL